MKTTKVVVAKKKAEEYAGELLVAFVARDAEGELVGDSLLEPLLPSLHGFEEFSAKKEQYFQMYPAVSPIKGLPPCKRLLLVGLGDIAAMSDPSEIFELLRTAGGIIAGQCKKNMVATVGINIPELESLDDALVGEYVTEGILLGAYQFLKYQKKDDDVYPGLKKN
jgi:leucyl aminopeptidase